MIDIPTFVGVRKSTREIGDQYARESLFHIPSPNNLRPQPKESKGKLEGVPDRENDPAIRDRLRELCSRSVGRPAVHRGSLRLLHWIERLPARDKSSQGYRPFDYPLAWLLRPRGRAAACDSFCMKKQKRTGLQSSVGILKGQSPLSRFK